MTTRAATRLLLLLTCVSCITIPGCRVVQRVNPFTDAPEPKMTEVQVMAELRTVAAQSLDCLALAADRLGEETDDPDARRVAASWKLSASANFRRIVSSRNPIEALIDLWVTLAQGRHFFSEGDGQGPLGDNAKVAAEAYALHEASVVGLAKRVLDAESFERASTEIEEHVAARPWQLEELRNGSPTMGLSEEGRSKFEWAFGATRFLAFATGVDETAAALDNVADVASQISLVAGEMPREVRWQAEAMLYDIDRAESVATVLERVDTIAASADLLATTAGALPDRVQDALTESLVQFEETQPDLQSTIVETRATLREAQDFMTNVEQAADRIEAAGAAWEPTMREIRLLARGDGEPEPPPDPNAPPSRPFDILDYAKTADSLTGTAGELRALCEEVRSVLGSDDLPNTLERAETSGVALADHVFWRAVQLILVLLAAVLGYRFAQKRWL